MTPHSPPRSTNTPTASTAPASPSGGRATRSSPGRSPRPCRWCSSRSAAAGDRRTAGAAHSIVGRAPHGRGGRCAGARHARHPQIRPSRSSAAPTGARTAGRAALDKLIGKLETAAALPIPLKAAVVRRTESNAIALPGGKSTSSRAWSMPPRTPDELAGVIAHEIGHVAHRDGTRSILQAAGLSFLFGMLLGDFTGGGVVVIAARKIVQSAYSRDVERDADRLRRRPDVQDRRRRPRARHHAGAHRRLDRARHNDPARSSRHQGRASR